MRLSMTTAHTADGDSDYGDSDYGDDANGAGDCVDDEDTPIVARQAWECSHLLIMAFNDGTLVCLARRAWE